MKYSKILLCFGALWASSAFPAPHTRASSSAALGQEAPSAKRGCGSPAKNCCTASPVSRTHSRWQGVTGRSVKVPKPSKKSPEEPAALWLPGHSSTHCPLESTPAQRPSPERVSGASPCSSCTAAQAQQVVGSNINF